MKRTLFYFTIGTGLAVWLHNLHETWPTYPRNAGWNLSDKGIQAVVPRIWPDGTRTRFVYFKDNSVWMDTFSMDEKGAHGLEVKPKLGGMK